MESQNIPLKTVKKVTPGTGAATPPPPATNLPAGVTQEQVDAWKQQYGALKTITVTKNEVKAMVILKPLKDRNVLAMAIQHATQMKLVEAGTVILENCKLYIDPIINTDDTLYVTACMQANQLYDLAAGEVGNL